MSSITESKLPSQYSDEMRDLFKLFQYDNQPINLVGSASLRVMKYFNDLDFYQDISKDFKPQLFKTFLRDLLLRLQEPNHHHYFIELKIQLVDGSKMKYFPNDMCQLNQVVNPNIDFVKIDIITRIDYKFIEASCIYKISQRKQTKEEIKAELRQDIEKYKQQGNFIKVLKRMFSIIKLDNNTEVKREILKYIVNVLNSEMGKKEQEKQNKNTMKLLKKYYGTD
jgi:hypothetical protein